MRTLLLLPNREKVPAGDEGLIGRPGVLEEECGLHQAASAEHDDVRLVLR